MKIHIVKQGDTLYKIAQKYRIDLDKLIAANPQISNPEQLEVGMKVRIPSAAVLPNSQIAHKHKVLQGDSLWKLAKQWGVQLQELVKANPHLKNPNALLSGEIVNIPMKGKAMPGDAGAKPTVPTFPDTGAGMKVPTFPGTGAGMTVPNIFAGEPITPMAPGVSKPPTPSQGAQQTMPSLWDLQTPQAAHPFMQMDVPAVEAMASNPSMINPGSSGEAGMWPYAPFGPSSMSPQVSPMQPGASFGQLPIGTVGTPLPSGEYPSYGVPYAPGQLPMGTVGTPLPSGEYPSYGVPYAPGQMPMGMQDQIPYGQYPSSMQDTSTMFSSQLPWSPQGQMGQPAAIGTPYAPYGQYPSSMQDSSTMFPSQLPWGPQGQMGQPAAIGTPYAPFGQAMLGTQAQIVQSPGQPAAPSAPYAPYMPFVQPSGSALPIQSYATPYVNLFGTGQIPPGSYRDCGCGGGGGSGGLKLPYANTNALESAHGNLAYTLDAEDNTAHRSHPKSRTKHSKAHQQSHSKRSSIITKKLSRPWSGI